MGYSDSSEELHFLAMAWGCRLDYGDGYWRGWTIHSPEDFSGASGIATGSMTALPLSLIPVFAVPFFLIVHIVRRAGQAMGGK